VAELNIQNGTLKALSFMMEYVGPMASDYIYAIAPMLEDALIDRDQVKRQTAMATIRHLALGVSHAGCEDACLHLLNFVWPNIFEESPHVKNACFEALDGIMVSVGPNIMLQYCLAGLFHPARRVRDVYWQIYNKVRASRHLSSH
jgi:splicing factor 3B subunit 1